MSKNTIKIDGKKLRTLLEGSTGKTIRELAIENGFSKNIISEAIRQGKASPIVQNLAKLYGISPEAYKLNDPEPTTKSGEQVSFNDLYIDRDDLKAIVKEAVVETFNSLVWVIDPITNTVTFKVGEETKIK